MNGYNTLANHNDVYFLTILATILVQYRSHLTILAAWWQLVVLCDSWQGGNSVEPLKQVQFYKVCIHWDFEVNLFSPSRVRFTSTQIIYFWTNQRDHRQPTLLTFCLYLLIFKSKGAGWLNLCVKSVQNISLPGFSKSSWFLWSLSVPGNGR